MGCRYPGGGAGVEMVIAPLRNLPPSVLTHSDGHQNRYSYKRAVRILLECFLVFIVVTDASACESCPVTDKEKGRPVGDSFNKYVQWFLNANPTLQCTKG